MINVDITQLLEENSDEILDWIQDNYDPDDVFDEQELKDWAEHEGYSLI